MSHAIMKLLRAQAFGFRPVEKARKPPEKELSLLPGRTASCKATKPVGSAGNEQAPQGRRQGKWVVCSEAFLAHARQAEDMDPQSPPGPDSCWEP